MPPVGDNLTSRIAAILLGSSVLFGALIVLAMLWPVRGQGGTGLFDLPVPHEAAAIVQALEAVPPQGRPLVLRALNSSITAVHIEPDFPTLRSGLERSAQLEWTFRRYSLVLAGHAFRVELKRGVILRGLGWRAPADVEPAVRLMVRLNTGGVLVLEHRPPLFVRSYIARIAALAAAGALVLLAGLGLAVRQTTRPVRRLAEAVRRFSLDRAAPDLPVAGPRELRELSSAFNEMQGRIRDLAAERTGLLAAIAHDLRTYLTRLRLRIDFIDDGDQRSRAERDIEEMSRLLDDTLLFAERTSQPATTLDETCDALAEVATLVAERREVGDPVALCTAPAAGETFPIRCSPRALRRMLNNLIDNAIRYGERARLDLRVSQAGLSISVEDDGPGVPPEALAEIVQPFVRLEGSRARSTGGAGLGLAIVMGLAAGCGAALTIENAPAAGLMATLAFRRSR